MHAIIKPFATFKFYIPIPNQSLPQVFNLLLDTYRIECGRKQSFFENSKLIPSLKCEVKTSFIVWLPMVRKVWPVKGDADWSTFV